METEQKEKKLFVFRNFVRWPLMIGMVLIVVAGLLYIYFVNPHLENAPTIPCAFHEQTGLYCPGCGDTRALHALVHGRILEAFGYNLLFPFIALVMTWYYLVGLTTLFCRKRVMWIPQTLPKWALITIATVIVLFAVLRNIPVWPFSLLAP